MAVSGVNNECFAYDNPSSSQRERARESGQRNEPIHIARAFAWQFATRINSPFHATKADGSAGRGKNMNKVNGQSDQVITEPITRLQRGGTGTNLSRAASPNRNHRWRLIVIAGILIAGAVAIYLHLNSGKKQPARGGGIPPLPISTATVRTGDIGVYVNALGTVTPFNTVSLTARVAGQIAKVEYQEGQLVHVGDPLVEIDPAPFQAAVTQAEGQLARDQAQLELAKLNLERDTNLLNKGVISKQEFDTQVATDHQSEGAVKLDQGNLDTAKVNLAYCHITSPIDGRVGLRMVDPGNIVQANGTTPLVVITQLQPISVEFNVSEDAVPQIMQAMHNGDKPEADAYDRANQKKLATGNVESFNSQIDNTTGTLRLRATFKNDDAVLFPNQFVNVQLLVDTHKGVTLLPNNAIQRNDNGAFVYVVQPNQTVALKTITVGTTDGNVSEVQGLQPGSVVAADSFNRLSDGAKVTSRPSASAAKPTTPNK
jgi:membrane fusion protein, multidrug efflux system